MDTIACILLAAITIDRQTYWSTRYSSHNNTYRGCFPNILCTVQWPSMNNLVTWFKVKAYCAHCRTYILLPGDICRYTALPVYCRNSIYLSIDRQRCQPTVVNSVDRQTLPLVYCSSQCLSCASVASLLSFTTSIDTRFFGGTAVAAMLYFLLFVQGTCTLLPHLCQGKTIISITEYKPQQHSRQCNTLQHNPRSPSSRYARPPHCCTSPCTMYSFQTGDHKMKIRRNDDIAAAQNIAVFQKSEYIVGVEIGG